MRSEVSAVIINVIIEETSLKAPVDNIKALQEELYNAHDDFLKVAVDDLGPLIHIEVKVNFENGLEDLKSLVESKVKAVFKDHLKEDR